MRRHTIYILDVVNVGSTTTRSPLGKTLMKSLVRRYCSAISGEMLALNPPVLKGKKGYGKRQVRLNESLRSHTQYP